MVKIDPSPGARLLFLIKDADNWRPHGRIQTVHHVTKRGAAECGPRGCDLSASEDEAGEDQAPGQPGLCSESLSIRKQQHRKHMAQNSI